MATPLTKKGTLEKGTWRLLCAPETKEERRENLISEEERSGTMGVSPKTCRAPGATFRLLSSSTSWDWLGGARRPPVPLPALPDSQVSGLWEASRSQPLPWSHEILCPPDGFTSHLLTVGQGPSHPVSLGMGLSHMP